MTKIIVFECVGIYIWVVKFVLVIPVLLLFIGQVPWMKNMEEKMTAMNHRTEKTDCCKKKEKHCGKEEAEKKSKDESCCNKTEARCACICCFSIAPVTEQANSHASFAAVLQNVGTYIDQHPVYQYYPVLTPPPDALHVIG